MDPDATFAIIVDDSETRENRLDAIADLTAWLQSDGYIPTRLANRVRTMERYGNRTSCVIWLDGFATALTPDRDIAHGERMGVEFPAFFAREGQSSLPPLPPPPPIPEWLDEAPHVGHRAHFTGAWYCDTCDSPYCDLA